MEEQDLREIGISDPQHRRKLLQAARSLPKVTAHNSETFPEPGTSPYHHLDPEQGRSLALGHADHCGVSSPHPGGAPEGSTESSSPPRSEAPESQ